MDQELFSELVEPPIQPAMLHMEPLRIHGQDGGFNLHICLQLLRFSWRSIRETAAVFKTLQKVGQVGLEKSF